MQFKKNISKYFGLIIVLLLISFSTFSCKKKKKKTVPDKKVKKTDKKLNKKEKITITNTDIKPDTKNDIDGDKKDKIVKTNKDVKSDNKIDSKPEKVLTKEEKEKKAIKDKLSKANHLIKKGGKSNLAKSIMLCKKVLKKDFQNFKAMILISKAQYNLKNYKKMKSVLMYIVTTRKKMKPPTEVSGMWHVLMGRYYLNNAKVFESREMFLKAIGEKKNAEKEFSHKSTNFIGEAQFVRGSLALERGYVLKAIKALERSTRLLSKYKIDYRLYLNLGVGYIQIKNYMKAIGKLEYSINLNKKCYNCHYNLAIIYSSWDSISKIGRITVRERAEKVMYHSKMYRKFLMKNKKKNKTLILRTNKWISEAKIKFENSR
jgi:tetratricopeptide (TPR) repeat protein